ncbi:minor tail protein [Mycobacterium phage Mundrea]|uniref:Minor tail protein n=1 Tax=Mycobacterium phage Mundrea TaxID=1897540 RepID=A0A1C9LYI8_9CAUD|nr:minor tail protein [Mycobacterium phage Mundrea]AOQ27957.1 minor tail protein [Mycobacterium phage Mundrea]
MTYRYLPSFGIRLLQLVILGESFARGLSMILSQDAVLSITDITNSAPMPVWGALFIAFAVLGFFGEALMSGTSPTFGNGSNPRAWPSFVAHAGLMILYLTIGVAYTHAVARGELHLASAPAAMAVFAFTHWLFARRRKHHAS